MMTAVASLLAVALATLLQSPAADSLRLLALRLPESVLALETRARPLAVREAVSEALARSVRTPTQGVQQIELAHRIAAAYAAAWRDSFLVREVARFSGWPARRRAGKIWADSVRRAGVTAFGRDGPTAAILVWRRSLARATTIGDTALVAAVLGNIGAGFLEEGRLDSAEIYLEQARVLAQAVGDFRVQANALGTLAGASHDRGDLAAARERYTRALALRERIGDTRGVAADYNNLGLLAQTFGDLNEAGRQFEAALALNRREGRDEVAATNLINLAGLASLAGKFAGAEALYKDALATWRAQEQWANAADALQGLGQLELRRGDYPAARVALGEALDIYSRTGPLADALAVRRELAGAIAAAGDLQSALDELRRAQWIADSARAPPGVRAGIALARADLAVQLNAPAVAERLYSQAERLYRQARDPTGEAEAQQGRGQLLLARDDYPRAQSLLETVLRTQLGSGSQRAAALTRLSLGQLSLEQGDTAAGRRQLARAAADLDRLGDPVAAAAAHGERAPTRSERWAACRCGVALPRRTRAARGPSGARSRVAAACRAGAGAPHAGGDRRSRPRVACGADRDRAHQSIARAGGTPLRIPCRQMGCLRPAGADRAGPGRPAAAFEVSERLRAREMLALLARGRVTAPPDTVQELVTREQDLRRRIAELTRDLEGATAGAAVVRGEDMPGGRGPTQEALLRAQESYADLLLEVGERAPRHAGLVSGETVTWREVARHLAPDQALVEYLISDSGSLAFVAGPDTLAAVELAIGRRELARLVEFARGTLVPKGSGRVGTIVERPASTPAPTPDRAAGGCRSSGRKEGGLSWSRTVSCTISPSPLCSVDTSPNDS